MQDIKAGTNDKALMDKYNLSSQGLQSLFGKLVSAGVITQTELDERVPMNERTVDLGLFICPACGNIQGKEFVKCPRCGFTVKGKSGDSSQQRRIKNVHGKNSPLAQIKSPKLLPDEPEDTEPEEETMKPALGLIRIMNYCRVLSVAAVIIYVLAVIGLLFILMRSPDSTAFESLMGVVAIGVPAVAIAVIVFVSLRVLTEAVKVVSSLSGRA